jgi:hypothetical protein
MLSTRRRFCLIVTVMVIGLLLAPTAVFAHERRTIAGGMYDVVVGWEQEPAFVYQPNAASISVTKAGTTEAVEGLEKTLKVRIAFGGSEAREFPLRTVFNRQGYYVADLIPTRSGSYILTFVGDIEGVQVNERFESGPGRFNDVEAIDELEFPRSIPDPLALADEVQAVRAESATARTLALIGLAVGVIGLIVGAASLRTRRAAG